MVDDRDAGSTSGDGPGVVVARDGADRAVTEVQAAVNLVRTFVWALHACVRAFPDRKCSSRFPLQATRAA